MKKSKQQDLISIVVPAYNHEKYIGRCIDSIIEQTYKNIELIIVNDGSADNTSEKIKSRIKECEKRFFRFIFIDKKNEGVIKTMNKGCFKATGKYISVCASDDAYTPKAIETLQQFLSKNPEYVLAVGDSYIMDGNGKRCYWDKSIQNTYDKNKVEYLTFGEKIQKDKKDIDFLSNQFGSYEKILEGNHIPNGYLFNRNIFINKIGGYSEKGPLEDYYLHLKLSKYGKYKFIKKPLFYYRWHGENTILQREKMEKITKKTFLLEQEYCYTHGLKEKFDNINKTPFFTKLIKNLFIYIKFYFFKITK